MAKAPQHSLAMAKLVTLCSKVEIPKADKGHFYDDFGEVVK
jgi:hypothetical protein